TGDLIQISINDTAKDTNDQPIRRELVIAAYVLPGHAENSITIPLGYGRKKTGPIAHESGFNAYFLRTANNPHFAVADGKNIESVRVTKVGKKYPLACTQEHWSIEGRGVVREATLDGYVTTTTSSKNALASMSPKRIYPRFTAIRRWMRLSSGEWWSILMFAPVAAPA